MKEEEERELKGKESGESTRSRPVDVIMHGFRQPYLMKLHMPHQQNAASTQRRTMTTYCARDAETCKDIPRESSSTSSSYRLRVGTLRVGRLRAARLRVGRLCVARLCVLTASWVRSLSLQFLWLRVIFVLACRCSPRHTRGNSFVDEAGKGIALGHVHNVRTLCLWPVHVVIAARCLSKARIDSQHQHLGEERKGRVRA